jgi:dephospho-CoA kinase
VKSLVLGFIGKIGSGKSTLANGTAKALGWRRTGFGDYVRALAEQQGLPKGRLSLQDLGESLVNENPVEFCRAVLAQADWEQGKSLVVDGIRHTVIVTTLRETVAPSELLLVYVSVEDSLREARVQERDGEGNLSLDLLDSHSTESEVETVLSRMADLIVDGNSLPEVLVPEIVSWVRYMANDP